MPAARQRACRLLPLLLLLGTAAAVQLRAGALPPADQEFCADAVDADDDDAGNSLVWLQEIEPGLPDVPEEVVNATLAQFEFEYLVLIDAFDAALANGTLDASDVAAGLRADRQEQGNAMNAQGESGGDEGEEEEGGKKVAVADELEQLSWVPCSPERLAVTAEGCHQATPDGDERFWLRLHISCSHEEHPDHPAHVDSASFQAAVLLDADGELQVNISSVLLDIDRTHAHIMACVDPLCVRCGSSGEPLPGAPRLPETCMECVTGFAVAPTGVCEPAGTEGTAQPAGTARKPRPGMTGSTADFRAAIQPFVPSWPANKPNATDADLEEVQPGSAPPPQEGGGAEQGAPPPSAVLAGGQAGPEGPTDDLTPEPSGPYAADVCGDPGPDPEPLMGDPGMGEDVAGLYTVACAESTGECRRAPVSPVDPLHICGPGWFMFNTRMRLCTRCDRPGCLECKGCGGGDNCLGGNVCQAPCKTGYGFHLNTCVKCGVAIPGCGRCRRCSGGANCHLDSGLECICCYPGLHFNSTDGPRKCVRDGDLTVPEPDIPDDWTPKIPALSTLLDPAAGPQPLPPVVPPVVDPTQPPVIVTPPGAPVRDPALDQCQPLPVPGPVAPTAADAGVNGLTEPQMMQYGGATLPDSLGGAQGDGFSQYYLPCQTYPGECWVAPQSPADPAKPCGKGFYIFNQQLRLCTLCDRPGCSDCVACDTATNPNCDAATGQFCTECVEGFAFSLGSCVECRSVDPNCQRCSRCVAGPDCQMVGPAGGVRCDCCAPGFFFGADATAAAARRCVPQ